MSKEQIKAEAIKFFREKGFPQHDHEDQQAENYAEFCERVMALKEDTEPIDLGGEFEYQLFGEGHSKLWNPYYVMYVNKKEQAQAICNALNKIQNIQ